MDLTRRLKVGIYFNARRDQGGLYQYAVTLIHCLNHFGRRHQYTLFHATLEPLPADLDTSHWQIIRISRSSLLPGFGIELALMYLARFGWHRPMKVLPPHRQIRHKKIDIMLYVKPTIHTFLWPYPFIFPIHDLQHLLQPEFPEVSANGEWSRREFIYRNAVPKANAILTDSEIGREDVIQNYNIDPSKVYPLPYITPIYMTTGLKESDLERVRQQYLLPNQFLFYPAAFWPHKNHSCLLHAMKLLIQEYQQNETHLVFTGSCRNECEHLKKLSMELGLTERVHFLGYVPDEDLYPLYRLAYALVMPTFFGPTNIPVLEAWSLGCPVITSDIRGIREQIGDAGLLADPHDEKEFAHAIHQLITNPDLRDHIIAQGKIRVSQWTPVDFAKRLENIFDECIRRSRE